MKHVLILFRRPFVKHLSGNILGCNINPLATRIIQHIRKQRTIAIDDDSQVTFDETGVVIIDPVTDLSKNTVYSMQVEGAKVGYCG